MAYDIEQSLDVFDKLTQKIITELDNQYALGRLKGTDYANVYSNMMNTALQLCIDIPIKEYQVENEKKDLELKDKDLELKDKDLELKDKTLEMNDAQIAQITAQTDNLLKDLDVKDKSIALTDANIALTNAKTATEESQKIILDHQVALTDAQTAHFGKQDELIDKQKAQVDKDLEVKDRQIKGFDDRIKTDLFKAQLDSWSMMFSSGMLEDQPSIINNDEVSDLYNNMKAELR